MSRYRMDIDADFRKICKTCLEELNKAGHQEVNEDTKSIYQKVRDVFLKFRRK